MEKAVQMIAPATGYDWRHPQFWRNLFLYFWGFSLVGHVVEVFWALLGNLTGLRGSLANTIPPFAVAAPYGLGVVALYLVLYPWVQQKRPSLAAVFVAGALLTAAIELICALAIVAVLGYNPFWNYSHRFLNLGGWICLSNSLLFGAGSVVILRWALPWAEKVLARIRPLYLNIGFWILFVGYILVEIYIRLIR